MGKQVFHEPDNMVAVRLTDGRLFKGFINSLDPESRSLQVSLLRAGEGKAHKEIGYADTNAVFFIKDPDASLPYSRMDPKAWDYRGDAKFPDKVSIRRKDGKTVETLFKESEDYGGVFLRPSDPGGNIIRIFVPSPSRTSPQKGDRLGETLVKEGMISRDQLDNGLHRQKALRKKRIGEIFVDRGVVDHSEVAEALKVQKAQTDKRLGDILVASGAITPEQLDAALSEQKNNRSKRLGQILIDMDLINEEMLALALALRHGLPYVDLNSYAIDPLAISCVSSEVANKLGIIPIDLGQNRLTVAFSDPTNLLAKSDLSFHAGLEIKEVIASGSSIRKAINQHYGTQGEEVLDSIALEDSQAVEEVKRPEREGYDITEKVGKEKPIIAFVNRLIKSAVDKKASDIHVEPESKEAKVYLRIDGILNEETTLPIYNLPSVIARMKVLAGMDIAERRLPQDGRAKVRIGQKFIDLRFSCMPTIYGESMVVRVLDKEAGLLRLEGIGFLPEEMEAIRRCIARPYGMILITGPTGSGKSSTIYACLQEPIFSGKNVVTLEDPVEYEIPGLSQVQIKEAIGLTFARGLRQILRHDPDVIVVGEIRDQETAKIGVQSALTGHLLISTLHTNTAAEAFVRLGDMGIEPYLISSSILGVLSQRLIRKVCTNCIEVDPEGAEKLRLSHFPLKPSGAAEFYKGEGCDECNNTGYKGRTAAYEFLPTTQEIKRAALKQETSSVIRDLAVEKGMKTIEHTALQKAEQGVTSVDEIIPLASELTPG